MFNVYNSIPIVTIKFNNNNCGAVVTNQNNIIYKN